MSTPRFIGPEEGEYLNIVGDRVRILVSGAETGGTCTIFETITAPGGGPPLHRHANEDETFRVVEGRAKFVANGETFIAEPGAFVYAPRGCTHTFVSLGPGPLRMVLSVTPSGLEVPFRENAALFIKDPNTPIERLIEVFGRAGVEFVGPPLDPNA